MGSGEVMLPTVVVISKGSVKISLVSEGTIRVPMAVS